VGIAGSTAKLLSEEEGRALLRVARASLRDFFGLEEAEGAEGGAGGAAAAPALIPARLEAERRGVFVTLTREGRLRGCTGYVEGVKALLDAVRDLAISSAVRDTRFEPVEAVEVASIDIEISVLTPPQPLPHPVHPSMVEVGRHGLIARRGARSGLLLPQVAPEWGWGALEFLERTCEKAGLPADAWRDADCKMLYFEAQIFDE
jgi:uncharacterized protein (TIGR00296 family)